jgi:mannose-1-phosphate guanylyltransferase
VGEPLKGLPGVFCVVRFREKPNLDLAETFVGRGNYRWNAGMFVWSVATIVTEFNRYAPELGRFIAGCLAPDGLEKSLRERFSQLPRISFDYAIMEHADHVLVVEASFEWDDVGSWQALARYLNKDDQGNAANCELTTLNAGDNIVFEEGSAKVALLGVNNLIIVHTRDAVLVCHRHHAEKIKNLVRRLPENLQ